MTSLQWCAGTLRFIDQTKLPHEEVYIETTDYLVVAEAIRKLQIRGAPAIGVAAAFGVVLAANQPEVMSVNDLDTALSLVVKEFSATRPTAVNLFGALARMQTVYRSYASMTLDDIRVRLEYEAFAIQHEDVEACRKIGEHGATLIAKGAAILTHCNTGALATAGEGTALNVIITAARQGKITRVYVDETRPLLQGARLTSWELAKAGIEAVLITDNTAGFLMQQRKVDAVIVGADRIAANGDVANKIGTYSLAVLAEKHEIPFYVAAPTSTIDLHTSSGKEMAVEERSAEEVTHIGGIRVAAEGISVYAPAFDITPNELVKAIVTECGVLKPPFFESVSRSKRDAATEELRGR